MSGVDQQAWCNHRSATSHGGYPKSSNTISLDCAETGLVTLHCISFRPTGWPDMVSYAGVRCDGIGCCRGEHCVRVRRFKHGGFHVQTVDSGETLPRIHATFELDKFCALTIVRQVKRSTAL